MVVFSCNRYDYVEKDGECFHSLRAAGLAIELAHKLARSEGYGNVHAGALSHVSISGSRLRVYVGDRWRKVSRTSSVSLAVQKRDRAIAFEAFRKQRVRCAEMGLNIWTVDPPMPRQMVSPDLLADAGPTAYIQVEGFVAIELKLFSSTDLDEKIRDAKALFVESFVQMQTFIENIAVGLLMVSVVDWDGYRWTHRHVLTWLWQDESWADMGGLPFDPTARRNRLVDKKPLLDVLNGMTWFQSQRWSVCLPDRTRTRNRTDRIRTRTKTDQNRKQQDQDPDRTRSRTRSRTRPSLSLSDSACLSQGQPRRIRYGFTFSAGARSEPEQCGRESRLLEGSF